MSNKKLDIYQGYFYSIGISKYFGSGTFLRKEGKLYECKYNRIVIDGRNDECKAEYKRIRNLIENGSYSINSEIGLDYYEISNELIKNNKEKILGGLLNRKKRNINGFFYNVDFEKIEEMLNGKLDMNYLNSGNFDYHGEKKTNSTSIIDSFLKRNILGKQKEINEVIELVKGNEKYFEFYENEDEYKLLDLNISKQNLQYFFEIYNIPEDTPLLIEQIESYRNIDKELEKKIKRYDKPNSIKSERKDMNRKNRKETKANIQNAITKGELDNLDLNPTKKEVIW